LAFLRKRLSQKGVIVTVIVEIVTVAARVMLLRGEVVKHPLGHIASAAPSAAACTARYR
jgi:hypothetical protein